MHVEEVEVSDKSEESGRRFRISVSKRMLEGEGSGKGSSGGRS